MPIRCKRWNDPAEPEDGFRLLICRYRPRALPKKDETWVAWQKELGPSKELHADFYGKNGAPITLYEYRQRYLAEMKLQEGRHPRAGATQSIGRDDHAPLLVRLRRREEMPPHATEGPDRSVRNLTRR